MKIHRGTIRPHPSLPPSVPPHAWHARTQRFNSGKSYGLRGDGRGGDIVAPPAPPSYAGVGAGVGAAADGGAWSAAADCLAETETHAVVRAGDVPAAAAAATAAEASRGGRCSGRVLSHGCVVLSSMVP